MLQWWLDEAGWFVGEQMIARLSAAPPYEPMMIGLTSCPKAFVPVSVEASETEPSKTSPLRNSALSPGSKCR